MKTLCLLLLALCLLLTARVRAVTVEIEFDASKSPEVTGYGLRESLPGGTVRKVAESSGTALIIAGEFGPGKHTVFVIAFAGPVASDPSESITFTVPEKPGVPRIRVTLQTSDNLADWKTVAVHYQPADPRQFVRATLELEP